MKFFRIAAVTALTAMLAAGTAFAAEAPGQDIEAPVIEEEGAAAGDQAQYPVDDAQEDIQDEAAQDDDTDIAVDQAEEEATEEELPQLQAAKKNGWVTEYCKATESKETFYYKDGEPLHGIVRIGDAYYCFDPFKGYMNTGFYDVRGIYYFSPTAKGSRHAGYMVTGWATVDGKTRYFRTKDEPSPDGGWESGHMGTAVTGWRTINGYRYHFDEKKYDSNGYYMAAQNTGWQKIDGKTYYFWPSTKDGHYKGVMVTGWQTINGYRYYFGKDGAQRTGWQKIDGKTYYFFPKTSGKNYKGTMAKNWQSIGGKTYYFGGSGVMRTGWQKINGYKYYFGTDGVETTGFKTIGGKRYYFYDGNKAMKEYEVNYGRTLYKGIIPSAGWIGIGGPNKIYFVLSDGSLATGKVMLQDEDGSTTAYIFDSNGLLK